MMPTYQREMTADKRVYGLAIGQRRPKRKNERRSVSKWFEKDILIRRSHLRKLNNKINKKNPKENQH